MPDDRDHDSGGATVLIGVIIGAVLVMIVGVFAFGGFDFGRDRDQIAVSIEQPQTTPPGVIEPDSPDLDTRLPE